MVSEDDPDASASPDATGQAAAEQPPAFAPHLDPDEPVRATLSCPDGYDCPDGPADSAAGPVELAVTDRRVLAVPVTADGASRADPDGDGTGTDPLSLPFTTLGAVSVTGGGEPALELVSADKVTYRFPLPVGDEGRGPAVADLRWLGEVRGRVLATSQEVLAAADRIEAHASDGRIDAAVDVYDRARAVLDRLLDTLFATSPVSMARLAPDLTGVERSLEAAVTRAHVARARDRLDEADGAVADHDFEAARSALDAAREAHDAAERHAAEVLRREEFRSGLERDLEETLRELGWEIEAVAAEPIRRAQEAVVEAQTSDDPAIAAEAYEAAIRDFRALIPMGWRGSTRQFDGDPRAVREDLDRVGERLLACYRTLAERDRERMVDRAGDDPEAAKTAYESAREHLERAGELAAAFAPDEGANLEAAAEDLQAEAAALAGDEAAAARTRADTGETDRSPDAPADADATASADEGVAGAEPADASDDARAEAADATSRGVTPPDADDTAATDDARTDAEDAAAGEVARDDETDTEAEPAADTEAGSGADTEAGSGADTEAGSGADTEAGSGLEAEPEAGGESAEETGFDDIDWSVEPSGVDDDSDA